MLLIVQARIRGKKKREFNTKKTKMKNTLSFLGYMISFLLLLAGVYMLTRKPSDATSTTSTLASNPRKQPSLVNVLDKSISDLSEAASSIRDVSEGEAPLARI
jgi:hypothetical protein